LTARLLVDVDALVELGDAVNEHDAAVAATKVADQNSEAARNRVIRAAQAVAYGVGASQRHRAAREADRIAGALDELRDAAARVRRVARRAAWPLDDLGPLDAEVDDWLRLLEELEARLDGAPPATSTTVLVIALGEPQEVQVRPSLTVGQLVAGLRRSGRVGALRLVHVTDNSGRDLQERELVAELAARSPLYVSYPVGWGG
jgi:hypothetical protein